MNLYHKDKRLPHLSFAFTGFTPRYSHHAIEAAYNDKYSQIVLPDYISLDDSEIIEIGIEGRTIVKVAIRQSYDNYYDVTYVFNPSTGVVITVWLNDKYDNHSTIDLSRYCD